MDFEFDPAKSLSNKGKHGIDFEEAKRLWDDDKLVELPRPMANEPRFLVIAMLDGRHWTAIITYRGAAARLISVRRSRDAEVAIYES